MKMKSFIKKYWLTAVGVFLCALIGWVYWYNFGCDNGLCTIKSDPWNMTIYGALMGGLFFDMLKGLKWFKSR